MNRGEHRGDAPRTASPGLLIEELLTAWPRAAAVFFRHHMACVGCAMSRFESLREAAETYGLETEDFLAELNAAITNL